MASTTNCGIYKDPTFDRVLRLEIRERQCHVCTRRVSVLEGRVVCSVGKKYPSCQYERRGFELDTGAD